MGAILNGLRILSDIRAVQFHLAPTLLDPVEGQLHWDESAGTMALDMPGGKVHLQLGQELYGMGRVRNESGVDIKNGEAVRIAGGSGNKTLISKADNTAFANAAVVALATEDIDNLAYGFCTSVGLVRGETAEPINTSSYAPGTVLWLSGTAGGWTDTIPTPPVYNVMIGKVVKQHASEGVIHVNINIIPRLTYLSDVLVTNVQNGDTLKWSTANARWENSA